MAVEKVCPANLYVQMISSEGGTGSNYVRLIGVNRRERKHQVDLAGTGSMSG